MKSIIFGVVAIFFTIFFFSNCSRCYKCTSQVIYEVNGVKDTSTVDDDYCTASSKELSAKENQGYKCTPQ